MIREILVLDLPPGLSDLADLPPDWQPGPLCSRQDVFEALRALGHAVDPRRPERLRLELGLGRFVELDLGPDELLRHFRVRFVAGAEEAVLALLGRLGFAAREEGVPGGLFRGGSQRPKAG